MGLWDIPVAKRVIHDNNYIAPPIHAAMYTSMIQPSSTPPIYKPHPTIRTNDYLHTFADMNDLIDVNETNILVEQQLKRDMQDFKLASITPTLNVIIRKKQPQLDLVNFLHGACFAPVASTWIKAIRNGHFATWPGLTPELVTKHLPTSVYTAKGHLNQERKFLQSTKKNKNYEAQIKEIKYKFAQLKKQVTSDKSLTQVLQQEILQDAFPTSDQPNKKTHEIVYAVIQDSDITAE